MDAVYTINDWWDGPVLGTAGYGEETCIYERVFSEERDCWLNQYDLTPVSQEQQRQIMDHWAEWLQWMESGSAAERAKQWHFRGSGKSLDLRDIARRSPKYRSRRREAEFVGSRPQTLYSSINDYYVIWKQPSAVQNPDAPWTGAVFPSVCAKSSGRTPNFC